MKYIIYKILRFGLRFIYFFMKFFPTNKNKITMISRQSNEIPLDFELLNKELIKNNYQTKIICKLLTQNMSILEDISYIFSLIPLTYHISTSKIVILDSYCLPIGILNHKKSLTVIQMWHSIGTMKKFGYLLFGKDEGSDAKIAEIFRMHENYDYIFCSSKIYMKHLEGGFNQPKEKMVVLPLPRLDILNKKYMSKKRKEILQSYPNLTSKKNILYTPTFRSDTTLEVYVIDLVNKIDFNKYNLIVKLHPLDKTSLNDSRIIVDSQYSSIEMLAVADFVISDYSCFIYEASYYNIPVLLYNFDFELYSQKRDLQLDYCEDLPYFISSKADEIVTAIENKKYDERKIKEFINLYITKAKKCYTKDIVDFIKEIR